MRVLHVVTTAGHGGAGIAAARLVKGLRNSGVDAQIACLTHTTDCEPFASKITFGTSVGEKLWIWLRKYQLRSLEKQNLNPKPGVGFFFSDRSCYGKALSQKINAFDIVHFHWVCNMLDYEYNFRNISQRIPIFWTLHDMNPFTAGCCYSMECTKYMQACHNCRILHNSYLRESYSAWQRKFNAFTNLKSSLEFIAPSDWMATEAKKSSLCGRFPIHVIANGIDTEVFRPALPRDCNLLNGLDRNKPTCLFVAANLNDPRKGIKFFFDAIQLVLDSCPNLQILCIGNILNAKKSKYPQIIYISNQSDEKTISQILCSADFLVVPSLMDNLPNVIVESLACGVPVVGFPVGGIPEMVIDGQTGFLADEMTSSGLATAMLRMINMATHEKSQMKHNARAFAVKNYSIDSQSQKFIMLYKSALYKS